MFRPITTTISACLFLLSTTLVACLDVPGGVYSDPDAGENCLKCHHESDELGECVDCHGAHGDSLAHEAHLHVELWGQPVSCEDCHSIPTGLFEGDHMNATVDVVFPEGSLATTGGLLPEWNGMRCVNVYCHGASLSGGTYTEPAWQGEKEEGIICGDCHGLPPLSPHPQQSDCLTCHSEAYTDAGALDFEIHLNGTIDF